MGHFLNANDTKICTARRWDMEDFFFLNRDMVSLHHVIGSKKSRRKTCIYSGGAITAVGL